jgi:hypothetical protein
MNARAVTVIGIIVVAGLLTLPSVRSDWVPMGNIYDGVISLAGHDYLYISLFHCAGQKVSIAFQCVSGGDEKVDFVVCDAGDLYLLESQYGSWEMQGSFTGYLQSIHFRGPLQVEGVSSWHGEFQVPHAGTWFYLFSNMFTLTTKTVQLRVDTYQWHDPFLFALAACLLALCIVAAVAAVVIWHRRKLQ